MELIGVDNILTYNDLAIIDTEADKQQFLLTAIRQHEQSDLYKTAMLADDYYKHLNPTIMRAQKLVYNLVGKAVQDVYSANNKIPSRYFYYFLTQEIQHLLGNGVSFGEKTTKERLGKGFDHTIQEAATKALIGGVSFAFWNNDHVEVFPVSKGGQNGTSPVFVPLYDEENGALRAGIRYWQIDENKPLRLTLYEEDGYTEYIQRKSEDVKIIQDKRPYKIAFRVSDVGGTEILNGENYPSFPIVPLWNVNHQSELVGGRETIDAYDLMASTLVNNVDDGNIIYWVLKNCGGMDDMDDAKFIERLKTTHVAHADGDDGASIEDHKIEAPFEANEVALERLRRQLFDDFMALDVKEISSGATTATQIKAAYEPLTAKCDQFEYQVTECIQGILALAGIDDEPTYTRSMLANQQEAVQTLVTGAEYLSDEYISRKILDILGDADKADEMIEAMQARELSRYSTEPDADGNEQE